MWEVYLYRIYCYVDGCRCEYLTIFNGRFEYSIDISRNVKPCRHLWRQCYLLNPSTVWSFCALHYLGSIIIKESPESRLQKKLIRASFISKLLNSNNSLYMFDKSTVGWFFSSELNVKLCIISMSSRLLIKWNQN